MTFYTRRDRLMAEVKQERATMRRRQIVDMIAELILWGATCALLYFGLFLG
jgi:hypothetical protein